MQKILNWQTNPYCRWAHTQQPWGSEKGEGGSFNTQRKHIIFSKKEKTRRKLVDNLRYYLVSYTNDNLLFLFSYLQTLIWNELLALSSFFF